MAIQVVGANGLHPSDLFSLPPLYALPHISIKRAEAAQSSTGHLDVGHDHVRSRISRLVL
jgi:hypothetical protein